MINFLIYHHSQKYSFTRRPNIQLYMQFPHRCKQKIKNLPIPRRQQSASPSPSPKSAQPPAFQYQRVQKSTSAQPPTSPTPQNTTTSQQPPVTTTKNSLKKARGVCRGAVALRPLCGFHFSPKKNISSNKQIFFFRLFLNTFIQTLQKI